MVGRIVGRVLSGRDCGLLAVEIGIVDIWHQIKHCLGKGVLDHQSQHPSPLRREERREGGAGWFRSRKKFQGHKRMDRVGYNLC
jgi:hypothetical protein